jgi:hypothetical protein
LPPRAPSSNLTTLALTDVSSVVTLRATETGLTAAGSNQSTALGLTSYNSVVETVTASTGVRLPSSPVLGEPVRIWNRGANALSVYPQTGAAIEALATNAAYSLPVNKAVELVPITATLWLTLTPAATYS